MTQRDEYVEKMKEQLDEMNAAIDRWQGKAREAEGEMKEKYEVQLAAMREKSDAARAKLAELRDSGEDRWQSLRAEVERIKDALVHSYNYFKSQL